MTNREWLNTLSNEELVSLFYLYMCDVCIYTDKDCTEENSGMNCKEGCIKWLEQEHEVEEKV